MNNKITLQELAAALAAHKNVSKKTAEAFVRHMFDIVQEYAMQDGQVKIKGFGTFKLVGVESRESVNVNTGERVVIDGHFKLTFTPDAALRDQVNKPFADFTTVVLNPGTDIGEMEAIDEEEELTAEEEEEMAEEVQQPEAPAEEPVTEAVVAEAEEEEAEEEAEEEEAEEEPEVQPAVQEEFVAVNHIEHQTVGQMTVGSQYVTNQTIQQMVADAVHQELASRREVLVPRRMLVWLSVLAVALLFVAYYGGYYIGTQRGVPAASASVQEQPAVPRQPKPKARPKVQVEKPRPAASRPVQPQAQPQPKEEKPQPPAAKPEEKKPGLSPSEIRKRAAEYEQIPDGNYLIIGTKDVHIMSRGDNMYKIAKATYGDSKLASYIIFYNKFRNPDKVFLGAEVRLPELVRKE